MPGASTCALPGAITLQGYLVGSSQVPGQRVKPDKRGSDGFHGSSIVRVATPRAWIFCIENIVIAELHRHWPGGTILAARWVCKLGALGHPVQTAACVKVAMYVMCKYWCVGV